MPIPPAEARASTLAIIPARAGSKGIPGKNILRLAGRPLLYYTAAAAEAAKSIGRAILSTDSEEIAGIGRSLGLETPFLRPADLAQDDTPTVPVILHALAWLDTHEGYRPDLVVLLQPTAPLRTAQHIDAAVELLLTSGADSVVSVADVPGHYHPDWQLVVEDGRLRTYTGRPPAAFAPQRQQLTPTYTRNGAIYACRLETLLTDGNLFGQWCVPYFMPPERSINLDSELDWKLAELLLADEIQAKEPAGPE